MHIFLTITLIFVILSFVPHVVKNTRGETGAGKTKPTVSESIDNISRNLSIKNLKAKEQFKMCGKIFLSLQMRRSAIDLRGSYERDFMKKIQNKIK